MLKSFLLVLKNIFKNLELLTLGVLEKIYLKTSNIVALIVLDKIFLNVFLIVLKKILLKIHVLWL